MDIEPTPGQVPHGADPRMMKLLELKAQMEQVHARLEYLRLMLRLRAPGQ